MYLGRIVEKAGAASCTPTRSIRTRSRCSPPSPSPIRAARTRPHRPAGEVPSPANPPTGCPFHPRCPLTRAAAQANAADMNQLVSITYRAGQPKISLRVADFGGIENIKSAGEEFPVLKQCVRERPPLAEKNAAPGHVAACWVTK